MTRVHRISEKSGTCCAKASHRIPVTWMLAQTKENLHRSRHAGWTETVSWSGPGIAWMGIPTSFVRGLPALVADLRMNRTRTLAFREDPDTGYGSFISWILANRGQQNRRSPGNALSVGPVPGRTPQENATRHPAEPGHDNARLIDPPVARYHQGRSSGNARVRNEYAVNRPQIGHFRTA